MSSVVTLDWERMNVKDTYLYSWDSQTKSESLSLRRAWRVRLSVCRFCAFSLRTWKWKWCWRRPNPNCADTHLEIPDFILSWAELSADTRLEKRMSEIHVLSTEGSQTKADSLSSRRAWRFWHFELSFDSAFSLRPYGWFKKEVYAKLWFGYTPQGSEVYFARNWARWLRSTEKPNIRNTCLIYRGFTDQSRFPFIKTRLESQTLCLEVLCLRPENLEMISKGAETGLWCGHPPRGLESFFGLSWAQWLHSTRRINVRDTCFIHNRFTDQKRLPFIETRLCVLLKALWMISEEV